MYVCLNIKKQKMKKLILPLLLLPFGAIAQSDNATLNIRLYPIQSIIVNPAQKTVNLDYKTQADYRDGVSSTQENHLTTYSTGGFQVKVKSASSALTGQRGNIESSDVDVIAKAGSASPLANAQYQSRKLSATEQVIITSTSGSVNKNFDITYKAAGADKYVDKVFKESNPSIYTTVITYTIEAN